MHEINFCPLPPPPSPPVLVLSSVFVLHLNHPPRMISSYCGANTPREKRCISGKVCVVLGARSASKNPWKHVGRILLTQNRTDVATARPSYRHHARARSKMAMGCRHGGDTRLPPSSITLRPRCSLGSGRIDNCGALSRGAVRLFSDGPSPQCRQSGWSLSHCSTNSTAPYKACTGSSSSSSHRPSSFRARQRSWPAVAAVGSSPRAAAGAGSSRPGEASGSPAGAEGSTGSAGGSSWRCWMRVVAVTPAKVIRMRSAVGHKGRAAVCEQGYRRKRRSAGPARRHAGWLRAVRRSYGLAGLSHV